MAPDPSEVCATICAGLDPDLQEYLAGGLVEEGVLMNRADAIEFAAPMLEELCDNDAEAAEALAGRLWEALKGGGGDGAVMEVANDEDTAAPRKLENAVSLASGWEDIEKVEEKKTRGTGAVLTLYDDLDDAKASKLKQQKQKEAAKVAEERAKSVAAMTNEVASLNLELETAREAAARMKLEDGAPTFGAIEITPFTLPNPGGGLDLLEEAQAVLVPGRRYGLIGRNGKGKSTLLRHLGARRVSGFKPSMSVYYVHQEVTLTAEQEEATPMQHVLAADVERRLLLAEQAQLAESEATCDVERLAQVEQRLEAIGAVHAAERAERLLMNLGFSTTFRNRAMKALSGGWRVRTALAAALFAAPDVLLLDEPTNHLSIDAVLWLARHLATDPTWDNRIMVIVSHDRYFLDETCTDMLHISGAARRLTQHRGSYGVWAERRAEQQKAKQREFALRDQKIETLRKYTQHGFKYGGSQGQISMQQKKVKEIHKLEVQAEIDEHAIADLQEDEELPLRLEAGGLLERPAIQLSNVGFSYGGKGGEMLFQGAEFSVDSKSRVCLLGENGAGKTTLVKVMQGELPPTVGHVARCAGSRIETVNQHHASQLNLDQTPLQFMAALFPGNGSLEHEGVLRGHLAGCGVSAELQTNLIRGLSGGQRSRVAMAAVSYARPHVLILDEPTNNLDLEAVAALADCVEAFEGGVVLVSHDNYFVSRVAKEVWVVGDGKVVRAESFSAYKKKILQSMDGKAGGGAS